jgi:hypothetical protein
LTASADRQSAGALHQPPNSVLQHAPSNPFSTRWTRPGAIPFQFPPGLDAAELVERLAQFNWRAAIRGPHGSGKSTLLAALAAELERRGQRVLSFALHDGQRRLPDELVAAFPNGPQAVVVVDGYEQLSRWSRWRLDRLCQRSQCGLLVTTHEATRFKELFRTRPDLDLAQRVVGDLLRADDGAISSAEIARAFESNCGDLRETLFSLYDLVEQRRPHAAPTHSAARLG